VVSETVTIKSAEGLHARPAAEFVRIAAAQGHNVMIAKGNGARVRGDSILSLLSLGVKHGEKLTIEVTGPDENSLIQSLITVVTDSNNR
jgi:phosphocarrier protein HPr